ncbi:hypothetical protein CTI12_AA266440 [Artemisia annua]|uniref:Uncharacterized protein n=1 Tax=Artemisia annua TaxID=35608 RepID=A0A2U1NGC5_ARTAN|nr:hypothetical protein CTI12_AA266440 [Artemisia annua]
MIKDRQAYEIRNGGFGILDRYEEDLNDSDSSKRNVEQELDKLEKKVDLLDSIVNELEYDFATWFSEDPDNTRLKDIKAKYNLRIRNIDLYGYVKGKSLVVYDDETGKDKDCIRNVDLCGDGVVNNGHIHDDLENYDLDEGSENDDDGCNDDNIEYDDHDDDGFSHLTKESDHEIVKGFTVFEVPEIETVVMVKEGITCVQLLEEEMHKVLKKSELEYEKKITSCEDGFKEFGISEILKEAEQKIHFSPYGTCKNVTFEKDLDAKMSNEDEFLDEKKVEPLPCFTSPVVISKKVTFEKDLDPKTSSKNQFVDEKKVEPLSFFNRPFVVSSSFPQHSSFDAPSFSLGREFEHDPDIEDEKPVIKEISVRQNPRRDVVVAAHSRSPFKVRQILPNVAIKQSEERVADVLFMMPEDTNPCELVYKSGSSNSMLIRLTLESLAPGITVEEDVIGVWSDDLNFMERFRAAESPSRYFFKPAITKHIIDVSTDFPEKYEDFEKVILGDYQAKRTASSENFNLSSAIDEEVETRYCSVPELLIKMFAKFHSKYNSPNIGFSFERVVAKRIKMGWRTVDNYLDDGVFVMSHMNMFFGESEGKWDYGLLKESKEQTKQLNTLRTEDELFKVIKEAVKFRIMGLKLKATPDFLKAAEFCANRRNPNTTTGFWICNKVFKVFYEDFQKISGYIISIGGRICKWWCSKGIWLLRMNTGGLCTTVEVPVILEIVSHLCSMNNLRWPVFKDVWFCYVSDKELCTIARYLDLDCADYVTEGDWINHLVSKELCTTAKWLDLDCADYVIRWSMMCQALVRVYSTTEWLLVSWSTVGCLFMAAYVKIMDGIG